MAVRLVIQPIVEADFCETSYGFGPHRSAHNAAAEALRAGYGRVIDADPSQYFETIPHAKLIDVVTERIADGAGLALIQQ